jgi:DNA polymerase-3 subunit delta'
MFSHLIGNERVKESLTHLLRSGRLPNSLLFAGPDGVGKKQFAIELARAFVCQESVDGLACRNCAGCSRVGQFYTPTTEKGEDYEFVFFGEHPDVGIVIPYKRILRVNSIRALEKESNFRPFEARARVFIIEDAEKMNDASSNALLKTLEEPPSTTFLILITSRPDALLSTIRSRCQTIRFAPVANTEIEKRLVESRKLKPADAKLAARVANGSVGQAMEIDLDSYRSQRTLLLSIIEKAFVSGDRAALLRSSEQLNDAKNKDFFESNLEILESLIRDMWTLKQNVAKDLIKNFDEADKLNDIAVQVDGRRLEYALAEIESLRQSFAVNINRKIAADALFMKIAA